MARLLKVNYSPHVVTNGNFQNLQDVVTQIGEYIIFLWSDILLVFSVVVVQPKVRIFLGLRRPYIDGISC